MLRGPALSGGQSVIVDGEPVFVAGGTPRVLTRAWTEPTLVGGRVVGTVRTQLLVQVTEPVEREPWRLAGPGLEAVLDRALQEGRSFESLRCDLRLDGSRAVVVIGSDPLLGLEGPAAGGPVGERPAGPEPASGEDAIETIGERMLVTPAVVEWDRDLEQVRSVRPSVHRVVVLLPRTGGSPGAADGGEALE